MGTSRNENDYEIDLAECIRVWSRHKKLIMRVTGGVAVASIIISFLLPPIFRAETKILPPQQGTAGMAAQLMSQLGGIASLGALGLGIKTPNEMLYVGMLRSRTVYDRIIDRFGLEKVYGVKYREDARKKLDDAVDTETKDGIITLRVEDKDPKRAAAMANAFVEEVQRLSRGLAVTEAAQRRLFYQEQLADAKTALSKAEEDIKGFQERTGALKIDEQAKVVIASIARLRAEIAANEVRQKVMRTFATPRNPDVQRVEEELQGLHAELNKLEANRKGGHDPLMPTGSMPSVGTEYVRKLRDFKYYETLYELLAKQYEMAKLDEARNAVVLQVIDRAVAPEKKAKPRRILIVSVSTLSGFLLSLLVAYLLECLRPIYPGHPAQDGPSES